ncbi:DUF6338 family protein [Micromonospora lupini]|uniref:Uncharacterized protein n=1 Tax=Micromonospora lupini str. Lupac 08 TaxID=1150864 RepID=I0L3D9_9ACTN|nr:DUF6338 family protein [Micromonospora lupini]CCH18336.1 membrane hypothetical protein [Micromonospora lupini str. Lupac 08]
MPANVVTVAVLIAALAPGFCFVQAYRRHVFSDRPSPTREVIEFFGAGALATVVASLLILALGNVVPWLVSLHELVVDTRTLRASAWEVVASAGLVLLLSVTLCIVAGDVLGRRAPSRVGPVNAGVMSVRALATPSPGGREPYLAVELDDGRLVEGYLRHAAIEDDPARRDLVLQRPLFFSGTGYAERTPSPAVKLYVPGSMIRVIHLSYPPVITVPEEEESTAGPGSEVVDAAGGARSGQMVQPRP